MSPPTSRPRRYGFTLVELLMVIVVIGMLAALLLPAIGSAVRKAEAAISSEINQMAQALADFKSKYGDYPPSRILLVENGDYGTYLGSTTTAGGSTDINLGQLAQRSLTALRKFFPRVRFNTTGGAVGSATTFWYDFNGNGQLDNYYVLDGRECLAFFLGGIPTYGTAGGSFQNGMAGFGRNPQNPFMNNIPGNTMYGNNRSAPLFEFRGDRLVLIPGRATGIPGYIDANSTSNNPASLGYYAYFSAYGGSAYDPNDVNVAETDDNGTALSLSIKVPFPVYTGTTQSSVAISPPPNPYTSSLTNTTSTTTIGSVTYLSPQTFQIISPGTDFLYGLGGQYLPDATTTLPLDASNTTSTDPVVRVRERDNVSNFHNGRLE